MENRNYFLAMALSLVILVGWQYFIIGPRIEKERVAIENEAAVKEQGINPPRPNAPDSGQVNFKAGESGSLVISSDRESIIAKTARLKIETPSLSGSLNLIGGRFDDIHLRKYRETVNPDSPTITLFSPSGSPHPYYAEFGWVTQSGTTIPLPDGKTEWTVESGDILAPGKPVTLVWDNSHGLIFRRIIDVDQNYMFTIRQSIENKTSGLISLYPYGLVSRHETPDTAGFYILHEGLIGVLGSDGLQEIKYDDLKDDAKIDFRNVTSGWLGITDKYWASAVIPEEGQFRGEFRYENTNGHDAYMAAYLGKALLIEPGKNTEITARLFAGAKETALLDGYETKYKINQFELLIDWGWFYFLTKPMFKLIDWLYVQVSNFGVAILIVTVIIKLVFFPLANKSYTSMSRMKLVQPQMKEIQERYKDDRAAQQKAMMELYKKEKINPLAGCLPILIQIPVFFALYKVLFVTIEMRQAPFFGWIQDLAAPDPTTLFNLFGLLPYTVPALIPAIGVWPIIMGITMFLQMKLNPTPPDPTQRLIFTWMPVFFTFLLASFPAGLVIYWAWNNFLSILQQYTIMRRQGVKVELWGNLKSTFKRKSTEETDPPE